jgi:hypothetical protein
MFEFNDEYIGVVAGGLSDEDTLSLFQMAFEEMAWEIEQQMPEGVEVHWDKTGPYVDLDDEAKSKEFGLDRPASPRLTQGFLHSRTAAEKAFVQVVYE